MVHRLIGQKWLAKICRGTGERREEGGGREAGTGKREGGGSREETGTVLWSLGSRGVPWELSSGASVVSGGPGVPGVLLEDPWGLFGSSWALPRGSWDVFWGSVVRVEPKRTILRTSSWGSWQSFWEPFLLQGLEFFKKKGSREAKSRKSVKKL